MLHTGFLKHIGWSFVLYFISSLSYSQNTFSLDANAKSPEATLDAIEWISGYWKGEAFGGITEEVWTPPSGGSMMCAFKLTVDNVVRFYEMVTITEENGTLMLRLKHFNKELKGWEEKNETVDFKLVKVTDKRVYFDGFTFEKVSDDEINMYVLLEEEEAKEEVTFNYKRVKN